MTLDEYEAMHRRPKPTAPLAASTSGNLLPCIVCESFGCGHAFAYTLMALQIPLRTKGQGITLAIGADLAPFLLLCVPCGHISCQICVAR